MIFAADFIPYTSSEDNFSLKMEAENVSETSQAALYFSLS
jgi:hypothetical protein